MIRVLGSSDFFRSALMMVSADSEQKAYKIAFYYIQKEKKDNYVEFTSSSYPPNRAYLSVRLTREAGVC